jgi:hypothetical protein
MHCFRDAPSLHQFLHTCPHPELLQLIEAHLKALADFDDVPLGELAHFFILDREDSTHALASALGRNLEDIPIETCLSHSQWFELIIIVSDDGFGHVVFIPKTITDQSLREFFASKSNLTKEYDA